MEIKKRLSEVNAFDLTGKLAGEGAANTILATVRGLDGKTFELDVYGPEVFDVLSRRVNLATGKKEGKAS